MARLIDADRLAAFPHEPTSGTEDVITEWIEDIFSTEEIIDHKEDLEKLCWKVINGFIGVIETEPTVDAVEVVRCKDCRFNVANMETDPLDTTDYSDITCSYFMTDGMEPDDFCSRGAKMDGGEKE